MDADLSAAEIVFAQKLASGEPTTRQRALRRLQSWIKESSSDGKTFSKDDCLKLWKGLYYCMWMQDKMLIQEELADNMALLINHLGSDDQVFLFTETFFITMGREWHGIDRWRLDKFLMLLRRLVRSLFAWLKERRWSSELVEELFEVCNRTVLSTDRSIPDGVKFHFASVYLDELDLAGAESLNRDQVITMLEPFVNILADRKTSNYFFDSVIEEVFVSILHQFSDELGGGEDNEEETAEPTGAPAAGIEFNYAKIADMLFQIGKAKQMRSDRRKRLYAIVKKFKMAASGLDPMSMELDEKDICSDIDEEEIDNATRRLLRREGQVKTDREQFRKQKRKQQEDDSDDDDQDGGSDGDEPARKAKAQPKVTRKSKNKPSNKKRPRLSNEQSPTKQRKQRKTKPS
uniref:Uncharacterized protein n=1 Tax=Plectus sambesii TaxID=2011161 RepID=A0A914VSN6_9BILA